eukprot:scaffold294980_cov21-Tisochrysis_lutea.AAC.1
MPLTNISQEGRCLGKSSNLVANLKLPCKGWDCLTLPCDLHANNINIFLIKGHHSVSPTGQVAESNEHPTF